MNGQLTQMCGNFNLIFLRNYTVYEHAVFTVLTSDKSSIHVATHSNTKRKPGKWGVVKLPAVKNVHQLMWYTNLLHKPSSQTEFQQKCDHLKGDWYNFFPWTKEVCLSISLAATVIERMYMAICIKYSYLFCDSEFTMHKQILQVLTNKLEY